MTTNTTTQATAATLPDYRELGDKNALASSVEKTAGYLESCLERSGDAGVFSAYCARAIKACENIARDLRNMKDNNPALNRYRNSLYDLDEAQLEAFLRIRIDYQAQRIGNLAAPTTNHFLAELTAIVFTLAAISEPVCVGGVGTGFAPRLKRSKAA